MGCRVLILRPEPGASQTAARARELGLEPVVAPLFTVRPLTWQAPDPAGFDGVMMTSANAARQGGAQLALYAELRCYAVGETTAKAAGKAGFRHVVTGPSDAQALGTMMASDGVRTALHLCGEDRIAIDVPGVVILSCPVYRSDAAEALPSRAREALMAGALVLLYSPRAASIFAALCDRAGIDRSRSTLATISTAAAIAAGPGWAAVESASQPRDQALLELAAKLCNSAAAGIDMDL